MRNAPPSHVMPLISSRSIWLVAVLLLAGTLLVGCGATTVGLGAAIPTVTATLAPSATPTTVPTPTTQPTMSAIPKSSLPTLAPAAGWHTVLTLSDTTGAQGDGIFQQNFIATKPYVILSSCTGSGGLKFFVPGRMLGSGCTKPPRISRTQTLKPAHLGDSVQITVSPDGPIIWELLVAMED